MRKALSPDLVAWPGDGNKRGRKQEGTKEYEGKQKMWRAKREGRKEEGEGRRGWCRFATKLIGPGALSFSCIGERT